MGYVSTVGTVKRIHSIHPKTIGPFTFNRQGEGRRQKAEHGKADTKPALESWFLALDQLFFHTVYLVHLNFNFMQFDSSIG